MSSSARFGGSIAGADFNAGVVDPGDLPGESSQETEAPLDDPRLRRLVDARVGPNHHELREERAQLLGKRYEDNQHIDAFFRRVRDVVHADHIDEHERIKAECREQIKVIEQIKAKKGELEQELLRAKQSTAE